MAVKEWPSDVEGYNFVEYSSRWELFCYDWAKYGLITALYNQIWLLFH